MPRFCSPAAASDAADALGLCIVAILDGSLRLGLDPVNWPDRGRDGLFWTETTSGYLVLNATEQPATVGGAEIPAHGVAELPR